MSVRTLKNRYINILRCPKCNKRCYTYHFDFDNRSDFLKRSLNGDPTSIECEHCGYDINKIVLVPIRVENLSSVMKEVNKIDPPKNVYDDPVYQPKDHEDKETGHIHCVDLKNGIPVFYVTAEHLQSITAVISSFLKKGN